MKQIFFSYSHNDRKLKDEVLEHLLSLLPEDHIKVWVDTEITAGDKWLEKIEEALNSANMAIFLISASFLRSKFIREKEVPTLLRRKRKEGIRIIPLIARPCPWDEIEWIRELQARPEFTKPLSRMEKPIREEHLTRFAKEINSLYITDKNREERFLEAKGPIKLKISPHEIAEYDLDGLVGEFKGHIEKNTNFAFRITGKFQIIKTFIIERFRLELEGITKGEDIIKVDVDLYDKSANPEEAILKEFQEEVGYQNLSEYLSEYSKNDTMVILWNHSIPEHKMQQMTMLFCNQIVKELQDRNCSVVILWINEISEMPLPDDSSIIDLQLPEKFVLSDIKRWFKRKLKEIVPKLSQGQINRCIERLESHSGYLAPTYGLIHRWIINP